MPRITEKKRQREPELNSGLCDFRTGVFITPGFLHIVAQLLYLISEK